MKFLSPAKGISLGEYQQRRRQLMNAMEPGSIALIPGAGMQRRNRDIDYAFRQDSDLLYLCGFEEPDALLALIPGRSQGEVILFCRERDPRAEQWDGGICGPERAAQGFAVDDAFPITDVDEILPGLLEGRRRIYQTMGEYPAFDQKLLSYVATIRGREAGGAIPPGEFVSLKHLLHEQRLIKSNAEIQLMQKAATLALERTSEQCNVAQHSSQRGSSKPSCCTSSCATVLGTAHTPVLLVAAITAVYCTTQIMMRRCKTATWF